MVFWWVWVFGEAESAGIAGESKVFFTDKMGREPVERWWLPAGVVVICVRLAQGQLPDMIKNSPV